jgi:hypothetical protein
MAGVNLIKAPYAQPEVPRGNSLELSIYILKE